MNVRDDLILEIEPLNPFDKYAIKIFDKENNHIGYSARYYSESLTEYLNEGRY